MKKITAVLLITLFFILGVSIGAFLVFNSYENRTNDQVRYDLIEREAENYKFFITDSFDIKSKDEGGLFYTDYVYYLEGEINNNATVTGFKDILVNIDFLSKTDAIISSKEFTIYEICKPGQKITIRKQISIPEHTNTFNFNVISAKIIDPVFGLEL